MSGAAARRAEGSAGWRRALLVSIALNLFLAGLIVTHLAREKWYAGPKAPRIELLAATLPAADADKLRAEFEADAAAITPARAAFHQAQDAVRASFRVEPFDRAATERAMANLRNKRLALEDVLHAALAKAAQRMSVEGRNKIADWPPDNR
jgi:uncharacterized membrane protein